MVKQRVTTEKQGSYARYYIVSVLSAAEFNYGAYFGNDLQEIARLYHIFEAPYKLDPLPNEMDMNITSLEGFRNIMNEPLTTAQMGKWLDYIAGSEVYQLGPHLTLSVAWIYDVIERYDNHPYT